MNSYLNKYMCRSCVDTKITNSFNFGKNPIAHKFRDKMN